MALKELANTPKQDSKTSRLIGFLDDIYAARSNGYTWEEIRLELEKEGLYFATRQQLTVAVKAAEKLRQKRKTLLEQADMASTGKSGPANRGKSPASPDKKSTGRTKTQNEKANQTDSETKTKKTPVLVGRKKDREEMQKHMDIGAHNT